MLREVARLGSMSAAARALSYTQPAVSHHVARLEAEVGTPLVVRHGRGVRLTEAGRVLVGHADAVLTRLAAAEEEVAAIAGLRAGRVRLAAFPTATAGIVPQALAALRKRAPGVTVTLVEAEPPESLALVREGEVDVAVAFAYDETPPDADTGIREVTFSRERVRLLLPGGHPLAAEHTVELAALRGETWVAGCERCRSHLVHVCRRAGFEPHVAYATDDHLAVQRLVSLGLAVGVLPQLALSLHRGENVAVADSPELGWRRLFAVAAAGPVPPAAAALVDELAAAVGQLSSGNQVGS